MADDLDDFLKQAAQRRKQRQQSKAERPPIESAPPPVLSPAPSSVPTLSRSDDAYSRPNAPQSANRLEPVIDLSQTIETAQVAQDNRLPSQMRDQPASKPKKQKKGGQKPSLSTQTSFPQSSFGSSSLAPSESTTANAAVVSTTNNPQMISSGNIAEQLRNPQTLRTAIIVHEILKRPWQ
jgi:hypothetical protein